MSREERFMLAMAATIALALLLAFLTISLVGLRVANRNAEKNQQQSALCIQQGGAWVSGDCFYSQRGQP